MTTEFQRFALCGVFYPPFTVIPREPDFDILFKCTPQSVHFFPIVKEMEKREENRNGSRFGIASRTTSPTQLYS